MNVGAAPSYTDFQALSELRSEARLRPTEALDDVASQFESLFVQMMLKSMRDASIDGGLFDSSSLDTYQQMFDQQVSLDISQNGGIGLAETLVTQMGGKGAASDPSLIDDVKDVQPIVSLNRAAVDIKRQVLGLYEASNNTVDSKQDADGVKDGKTTWLPASPEEFIRNVWSYAESAAKQLGIDPAVLVAQSALETGWGKKVIQADQGSSFNLFGIKADGRWGGKAATVSTVEFRDGLAVLEKASFRAYDSLSGSFNDYVDFLKSNPRYQQALDKVSDNKEFLAELQDAGYATDPKYAEKILGILGRNNYSSVINELKNSQDLPLSS
ncbi:MAG: flagellar assembly peptidoglycan hydrolase FlgJ [Porticoccus sp.]|nr:flagellar assembly peptidoglycan hydrolase FlgJ [Porticoccus sp.]